MPAPLTPEEAEALREATRLMESGNARGAAEELVRLVRGGSQHPDVLLAYSIACEQLGIANEAAGAARHATQVEPGRADLWAHFGRLLSDAGRANDGVTALERAVALDPSVPSTWYNLGVAALSAGLFERAVDALEKSTQLQPTNAAAWAALGIAQQQAGAIEESAQSLNKALELDASLLGARHNLAVTLRLLDRSDDALATLDEGIRKGLSAPESQLLRAHLFADLGRFDDAATGYRDHLKTQPGSIDAHEVLARLLPQIGRRNIAFDAYDQALQSAPSIELYRSALKSAWDLKMPEKLSIWSAEALKHFGDAPDLKLMQGLACGLGGDSEGALRMLDPLIASGYTPAFVHGAYYRLKSGDLAGAERHALMATEADFADQAAWAYLTVIWRLMDDPREHWLADYERFVIPVDLAAPDEFRSTAEFMSVLSGELTALHQTHEHPADQSLRQGTQTRGNLFDKRTPLVRQLAASIQVAIEKAVSSLPTDPSHPFLGRNTGKAHFLGSWSVRLRTGGFHVSHIHQLGWLSSALYVSLPREVHAESDEAAPPGSLTFGIPDAELGIDLPARRVERPQVGRLVLFPSYFWHGTMPFVSSDYRLTVAFDAVPA